MADFYRGNPTCPRCGGSDTVVLEEPWWECRSRRVRDMVPEAGLRPRIPLYGPCGHRFDVEQVAARKRAAAERERREAEGIRLHEARQIEYEAEAREVDPELDRVDDLETLAEILVKIRGKADKYVSRVLLRAAFERAVERDAPDFTVELLEMTARPSLLGQLQKLGRSANRSQWGRWRESARLPVFAGKDRSGEFWIDSTGRLWRRAPHDDEDWARKVVFQYADSMAHRMLVAPGETIRMRRGRDSRYSEATGWNLGVWWVRFDAPTVIEDEEIEGTPYCHALASVIADLRGRA